jgi:hypothetical protein
MDTAISATRIGHGDPHPARRFFVAIVKTVPVKVHLDTVELVGVHLFVGRTNDNGRLQIHRWFVMFKRAAKRHDLALRFDFNEEEAFAAVGVSDRQRIGRRRMICAD